MDMLGTILLLNPAQAVLTLNNEIKAFEEPLSSGYLVEVVLSCEKVFI